MAVTPGTWAARPAEWISDAPGQVRSCTHRNMPYLLGRRRHQQRLSLPLARFQRRAGVAHFAGQLQALQVEQRFVDDHRPQLRRLVHDVVAVRRQVAGRRLLDVGDALETRRRLFLHLRQKLQQVADVRAALVEVQRIAPGADAAPPLRLPGNAVDADDALHVPAQVVAVELDLEVRQAVGANPLRQRLRQAVVDPFERCPALERIEGADEVIQRHPRLRLPRDVAGRSDSPANSRAEVMAEVVAQEIGAVGVIAVEAVGLAESVVEGGVEGAGGDEGTQRRDRLGQPRFRLTSAAALWNSGSSAQVRSIGWPVSVQPPMMRSMRSARAFIGREGGVVGEQPRRERPDVAERHRAEAAGGLAADGSHHAVHVQQRDPVEGRAAELDRRAVQVVLVLVYDGFDADVGRFHGLAILSISR